MKQLFLILLPVLSLPLLARAGGTPTTAASAPGTTWRWPAAAALQPPPPTTASCSAAVRCSPGCSREAVMSLLQQLSEARATNTQLRERLLRARHHTPLVLFGGAPGGAAVWQLVAFLIALAGVAAHIRGARKTAQAQHHVLLLQRYLHVWKAQLAAATADADATTSSSQEPCDAPTRGKRAWPSRLARMARLLDERVRGQMLMLLSQLLPADALPTTSCCLHSCCC
jgi:hypothetical protein